MKEKLNGFLLSFLKNNPPVIKKIDGQMIAGNPAKEKESMLLPPPKNQSKNGSYSPPPPLLTLT